LNRKVGPLLDPQVGAFIENREAEDDEPWRPCPDGPPEEHRDKQLNDHAGDDMHRVAGEGGSMLDEHLQLVPGRHAAPDDLPKLMKQAH